MGKAKKAPEAMARMSYLYQAANLIKKSRSKSNTSAAFARQVLSTNLGRSKLNEILETQYISVYLSYTYLDIY